LKLRVRKTGRRAGRALLRGTAFLALAAKLLVPVGYMPASLAEGGLRLCDSDLAAAFAAPPRAAAEHAGSPAGHGHHGGADENAHRHAHEAAAGQTQPHQHDDEQDSHHDWERCSLGGLASLAAVPAECRIALPAAAPERVAAAETIVVGRPAAIGFRSRAPPIADPTA
jgi:hypothetical protein